MFPILFLFLGLDKIGQEIPCTSLSNKNRLIQDYISLMFQFRVCETVEKNDFL